MTAIPLFLEQFYFFQNALENFFQEAQGLQQEDAGLPVTLSGWNSSSGLNEQNKLILQILRKLVIKRGSDKKSYKSYYNEKYHFFFWSTVREVYLENSKSRLSRHEFCQKVLPRNALIFLNLEKEVFKIKSGTNQVLSAFQNFVDDLCKADLAVIFFSQQNFLPQNLDSKKFPSFKMRHVNQDISFYEAVEPQHFFYGNSAVPMQQSSGTFDKMTEMMTAGMLQLKNLLETTECIAN